MLDPVKEFAEHDAFEREQAAKFQGMQELIRSSQEKFLTLEYNGVKIRIRPALPAKARTDILKLARKYKSVDVEKLRNEQASIADLPEGFLEDSVQQLYQSLAALCLDTPYNQPESWRYFDDQTGQAELVYQIAEEMIKEAHQSAISFRPESGGTGNR
jgi:hypothetical protein